MNFKLLMVVGLVAPGFIAGGPVMAGEYVSGMVIAQQQNPNEKDKPPQQRPPQPHGQPQGQPPMQQQQRPVQQQQQQIQRPVQQQQMQKPVQQQQQQQQQQMQKPVQQQQQQQMQKPVQQQQQQQMQKPVQQQQQQQLQKPVQQQQQQQLQKPVQQQQQQQQLQKPVQQQQLQKPVQQQPVQRPPLGQPSTIQSQQRPPVTPGSQRLDQVRGNRQETREGNRTVIREQNRTIIRENGRTIIRHDDTARFRLGARDVQVQRQGNNTQTIIVRPDGFRIITVVDGNGRLLRRIRRGPDGREVILIDNRYGPGPALGFIAGMAEPIIRIPRERYIVDAEQADETLLYDTLIAPPVMEIDRPYTLDEIRYTPALRDRMPRIDLDTITFDTGSWEVTPDQAQLLGPIANAMRRAIGRNPNEIYLIEGHTDAVGSDIDNLSLSDRRAESVAEILTQDFGIPPENLTTQGYGEQYLKIPTQVAERRNRRVTVRRITPLLVGRN